MLNFSEATCRQLERVNGFILIRQQIINFKPKPNYINLKPQKQNNNNTHKFIGQLKNIG